MRFMEGLSVNELYAWVALCYCSTDRGTEEWRGPCCGTGAEWSFRICVAFYSVSTSSLTQLEKWTLSILSLSEIRA